MAGGLFAGWAVGVAERARVEGTAVADGVGVEGALQLTISRAAMAAIQAMVNGCALGAVMNHQFQEGCMGRGERIFRLRFGKSKSKDHQNRRHRCGIEHQHLPPPSPEAKSCRNISVTRY